MSEFHQRWRIGCLEFHLLHGDLFECPVESIVNSEQTDFILSGNPSTISGQINHRFGQPIKKELYDQTGGEILPTGTVLTTGPVGDYKKIYHAGFHLPGDFPLSEDDQTEHLVPIRKCVHKIISGLLISNVKSVAFPLIGCGLFDLSPSILAYEFASELLSVAQSCKAQDPKEVWLVIYNATLVDAVLGAVVQAFIDMSSHGVSEHEPLSIGVGYLDAFERERVGSANHPQWSTWMLLRYSELLTGYLFYHLAAASRPPTMPHQVVGKRLPLSFGILRGGAVKLAQKSELTADGDEWTQFIRKLFTGGAATTLARLNSDRNNLAHGRAFRAAKEIRNDLSELVWLTKWKDLIARVGESPLGKLSPWTNIRSTEQSDRSAIGVLDSWSESYWTYLVPTTGEVYDRARVCITTSEAED